MYRILGIIILALFGIFIRPFDPGTIDFIYRFLIFSSITYLMYTTWKSDVSEQNDQIRPPQVRERPVQDNIPVHEDWNISDLLETDDKSSEFLKDQFEIMGSLLFPDTGWIFYQENLDEIIVFHAHHYGGKSIAIRTTSFAPGGVLEILAKENSILIENNLSKEAQLIPYHSDPDYVPNSFIGIPIFLGNGKNLYFTFDSQNKEHFNQEDRAIFAKIGKNIATFLINRLKGHQLLRALRRKEDLLDFVKNLNSSKTISLAIDVLAEEISSQFEASRLTISIVSSPGVEATIRKVIGQNNDFDVNSTFKLEEGLTGWIISKNKPYLIDDLEKGEYFIPRYSKDEKSNFGLRAFLGIPIMSGDQVYGALTLEHIKPNKYDQSHKARLQTYLDMFSTTFQRQKS
jgi:transcriptional regulator with GAF, ATPase, and Fis domain